MIIPFNKPHLNGKELIHIVEAHKLNHLSGDGYFTKKCNDWLEQQTQCKKALLTHSCTAALEIAAILTDIQPGDEVIMPSYTFVSTANAFVLRGGVPVFVDIRSDTLNIDETKIEAAITKKTKAIVPMHYAGVSCEMDTIMDIAEKYNLIVIEDAAQGIMATYKGKPLGSIGHLAGLSFHETKNIISGEGGALLINDENFIDRAEIIREKGTNRSKFCRKEIDKYFWVDIGSSYLPSEITAAFLWGQIEEADLFTQHRLSIWETYHKAFKTLEEQNILRRPVIQNNCTHNAHMYYIILHDEKTRNNLLKFLKDEKNISSTFHYIPLHSTPMGRKVSPRSQVLPLTDDLSSRLLRLPFYYNLTEEEQSYVIESIKEFTVLRIETQK